MRGERQLKYVYLHPERTLEERIDREKLSRPITTFKWFDQERRIALKNYLESSSTAVK